MTLIELTNGRCTHWSGVRHAAAAARHTEAAEAHRRAVQSFNEQDEDSDDVAHYIRTDADSRGAAARTIIATRASMKTKAKAYAVDAAKYYGSEAPYWFVDQRVLHHTEAAKMHDAAAAFHLGAAKVLR